MTVQLEKDQKTMVYLERLPGEKLFSLKRTVQFGKLHRNIPHDSCPFIQRKPKWRCLAIIYSFTFTKNKTQHINTNASYQLWKANDMDLLWCHRIGMSYSHWVFTKVFWSQTWGHLKKKIQALEWPSLSTDLKMIKMLSVGH